ncbi:MAG TPA: ABC transporter ATP-binding protein [Pirellulales bacterium]|nr:ABC transporter ATP-binding protein [Pirellulales bacterium]
MPDAIRIQNVSKRFRLDDRRSTARYRTLREDLAEVLHWGRRAEARDRASGEIWALRNLSLTVPRGEACAIIGRNGAGKSTLLKVLSRITRPTSGKVCVWGRVGSLLEVGTGFHPELTGRENIFLNGAILGMSRREIAARFDEIVAFAETEEFLEVPVKRYSTGMHMRLAFAVAAHLEPEVLLVDEVLAVGDAQFQRKCLGKMHGLADGGRTVLFVSHNMPAVQSLCTRAVWLEQGVIRGMGPPGEIVPRYLLEGSAAQQRRFWPNPDTAPGGDVVRLHGACIRPANGAPGDPITVRTPAVMEFEFWNRVPDTQLNLSVVLTNAEGVCILNTFPAEEADWHGEAFPAGLFHSAVHLPGDLLNSGWHSVELYVVKDETIVLDRHPGLISFEVLDGIERRPRWHGQWQGAVRPMLHWQTRMISTESIASCEAPH